jgi:AbrB family looped-hinge helix DNA binding protein
MEPAVATTLTVKGQVTIPKHVRDALGLAPGDGVEFAVNAHGEVVVSRSGGRHSRPAARPGARRRDRFEAARGTADVKWQTAELMALLRGPGGAD